MQFIHSSPHSKSVKNYINRINKTNFYRVELQSVKLMCKGRVRGRGVGDEGDDQGTGKAAIEASK